MPASILLHGPPGTGKTLLARAIAGEAEAAFLSVGPGDILSKFVGESEALVREVFKKGRPGSRTLRTSLPGSLLWTEYNSNVMLFCFSLFHRLSGVLWNFSL